MKRPPPKAAGISRRAFVQRGSAVAGGLLWAHWGSEWAQAVDAKAENSLVFRLVRDVDLLQAEVRFIRFRQRTKGAERWLEPMGFADSVVAVRLPPQNLGEAIFDEVHRPGSQLENDDLPLDESPGDASEEGKNNPETPIGSALSGPSWLVYVVPNGLRFPLGDVEAWFDVLAKCDLQVPRGALPPERRGKYRPVPPRLEETRLEIPFRLFIAPEPEIRTIFSRCRPIPAADDFRELWQAALESRKEVRPAPPPPDTPSLSEEVKLLRETVLHARAVWSPDYRLRGEPPFFLYYPGFQPLSLHALTRHLLVAQMGAGDGWIDAEHLILSALGASASLQYATQKPVAVFIKEQMDAARDPGASVPTATELLVWKHRVVVGRDEYFAEAFFGFLFPFTHPSIHVEITKRKPVRIAGHREFGFYLLKRRFLLAQNPLKNFAGSDSAVGRTMPLKKVRLTTLRSPDLCSPENLAGNLPDKPGGIYFWPKDLVTGKDVNWEIAGEDEHGQAIKSRECRLLFASNIVYGHQLYGQATAEQRLMRFDGSKVAFARETPKVHLDPPPGVSGRTPISFEVAPGPARFLTQIAAAMRAKMSADPPLADLQQIVRTLAADQVQATEAEVENVRRQVQDALAAIEGWTNKPGRLLNELHERLERAEKTAASMATSAMTFTSRVVDRLVDGLRHKAADLELALQDAATDTNQLIVQLRTLADAMLDAYGTVKKEADALKGENFVNELRNWLQDVAGQAESLAKDANAMPAEVREFIRRKLRETLAELARLEGQLAGIGSPYFHAALQSAEVLIPALKDVLPDAPARTIELFDKYVAGGIDNVRQGIYANLTDVINSGQKLADGVKNGIAQPAAVIAGLSREIGAVVADGKEKLNELAGRFENFDLSNALPDAKLFGVVSLKDLLGPLLRGELPKLQTVELPDKVERSWEWVASLQKQREFGPLTITFPEENGKSRLAIYSRATLHLPTAQQLASGERPRPELDLRGWLGRWNEQGRNFEEQALADGKYTAIQLELFHLIRVNFAHVSFRAHYEQGQSVSPDLDPKFLGVEFLGPLAFVSKLQEYLRSLGSGFQIDLQPSFISVLSSIELPPISFGIFSLRCLRLEQGLELPFGGTPMKFRFAFASFERPFELSVMGFAGRGFFSAGFWTDGKRELEGSLEFGGSLSFDVVVASGSLYLMAGVYFKITNSETTLAGYIRAGGNLNVLGLIQASVEFLLMVKWQKTETGSVLYGICTVTVSIDLFLFSMDVNVTMERTLAGSDHGTRHALEQQVRPLAGLAAGSLKPASTTSNDLPRPYITRAGSTAAGQFASFADWQRKYWNHFTD